MTPTEAERTRFRRKLRGTAASMPDPYIDDVIAEAEEAYPDKGRKVQLLAAYLLGIRDLRMAAASKTDYDQNESSEKASQLFKHLDILETDFQKDLEAELEVNTLPAVMWGVSRVIPSRNKEWPDDAGF